MKIRSSHAGSRQISATKGILSCIATAVIAGGIDSGFGGRALAAPQEVTYNGMVYTLDTTSCFAPGTISGCSGAADLSQSSWFGNYQLAEELAKATKDVLGRPNPAPGTTLGPGFAWRSQDPAFYNESRLVFASFEWDPNTFDKTDPRGGIWNSYFGTANIALAKETAPPRPVSVSPILATNNGSSVNTTNGLSAKVLLPQFEGGTLTVSSTGTITDNFTLNNDPGNTIDAAGNTATFSGVFSDQAGTQGNIGFKNSGSSSAVITLAASSTYSGLTTIWDNATVTSTVNNALPSATELLLYGNGTFNLNGRDQTIAAIGGVGNIGLGTGGTLTLNLNEQFTRNSSADITGSADINGIGGLIKDGSFTQVLGGSLGYTGTTTVRGGTLIINGNSVSETTVYSGATLGGSGVIKADVFNFGTVSPGQSIGTLTIDGGSYGQGLGGVLAIEVAGSGQSDLLQLTGSGTNQAILLEGTLKLSSYQGAPITPGIVYTAVSVPNGTVGGDPGLYADTGGVVGTGGYTFVRDEEPGFTKLDGGQAKPPSASKVDASPSRPFFKQGA
jgi:autotransporter-associated beta strand protein